jgi:hypothetical protein
MRPTHSGREGDSGVRIGVGCMFERKRRSRFKDLFLSICMEVWSMSLCNFVKNEAVQDFNANPR